MERVVTSAEEDCTKRLPWMRTRWCLPNPNPEGYQVVASCAYIPTAMDIVVPSADKDMNSAF